MKKELFILLKQYEGKIQQDLANIDHDKTCINNIDELNMRTCNNALKAIKTLINYEHDMILPCIKTPY